GDVLERAEAGGSALVADLRVVGHAAARPDPQPRLLAAGVVAEPAGLPRSRVGGEAASASLGEQGHQVDEREPHAAHDHVLARGEEVQRGVGRLRGREVDGPVAAGEGGQLVTGGRGRESVWPAASSSRSAASGARPSSSTVQPCLGRLAPTCSSPCPPALPRSSLPKSSGSVPETAGSGTESDDPAPLPAGAGPTASAGCTAVAVVRCTVTVTVSGREASTCPKNHSR